MQDRLDAGQDRSDAEQIIYRTGRMQDRSDAGQDGCSTCRTGKMRDRMDTKQI